MSLEQKPGLMFRLIDSGEISGLVPAGRDRKVGSVVDRNNQTVESQNRVNSIRELIRDHIEDRNRHIIFPRPGIPIITRVVNFQ
jgi:hypothetical protein